MKKLLALSLLGSYLLTGSNPAKADTNYFFVTDDDGDKIYESTVNNGITSFKFLTQHTIEIEPDHYLKDRTYWYDKSLNKLFFQEESATGTHWIYDLNLNTWSETKISSDNQNTEDYYYPIPTNNSNAISTNTSNISTNTSNISTNTSNISTNTSNISTNTSNISTNTSNISTNTSNISTNTSNISTNTSNIKNLGQGVAGSTALTAALTALPQTSKESKLSCGVGTGAYSSRYAVGFGCASKVNERVDINAGGSYVFGGSKSYGGGTLDSGVVKAGFVFKLGELKKPTQISMKENKELKREISILKENNQNILAQNQALLVRLERLEKIALGEINSPDLAVYQLK